jgi:hypothetical protein
VTGVHRAPEITLSPKFGRSFWRSVVPVIAAVGWRDEPIGQHAGKSSKHFENCMKNNRYWVNIVKKR